MYETFVESEMKVPGLIGRDDIQMWPLVYQRGAPLWFYVECRSSYEKDVVPKMICVEGVDNLIGLLANEGLIAEQLYLVSPRRINKSDGWKMEPLVEILEGEEPEIDGIEVKQRGFVYVLGNGKRYLHARQCDEKSLKNLKSIYRMNR